jgi:hypothetical protein
LSYAVPINQSATHGTLKISETAHWGWAALKSNRQLFEQKYSRDWRTEVAGSTLAHIPRTVRISQVIRMLNGSEPRNLGKQLAREAR